MAKTHRFLFKGLTTILALSLLVGLVTGEVAWCLVAGLLVYTGWHQQQLIRLYRWAMDDKLTDPPVSQGVWGDLFDRFHNQQKQFLQHRARLKKVIKRFRDSTFALHDGFVMIDSKDNLDWWNPAARQLLGLRDSDQGQPVTNLLRSPQFRQHFFSQAFDKAIELVSPVNSNVTLHCQISAFGKHDRLMVVRDITELKKLDQVRKDFVANVSHELRTPLTVVNGYLETMSDNATGNQDKLPPIWNKALPQMLQQTQRMNQLIEDLLLLATLETRGSFQQHQCVDMQQLLQSVASDLENTIDRKQQQLVVNIDSPLHLMGQRQELYSLTSNLIMNASKYCPERSEIILNWSASHNGLRLEVKDNGPGIAPQHLARLTERFYRVEDSRAQHTGGTGLGLAIVKHILINHDGRLEVQSQYGKGSTFICHFPITRAHDGTLTAVG